MAVALLLGGLSYWMLEVFLDTVQNALCKGKVKPNFPAASLPHEAVQILSYPRHSTTQARHESRFCLVITAPGLHGRGQSNLGHFSSPLQHCTSKHPHRTLIFIQNAMKLIQSIIENTSNPPQLPDTKHERNCRW